MKKPPMEFFYFASRLLTLFFWFIIFNDFVVDGDGHESAHGTTFADAPPNVAATDVVESGVHERNRRRKRRGIDGRTFTRIDDDSVVFQDVVGAMPTVEQQPVVGPDDE